MARRIERSGAGGFQLQMPREFEGGGGYSGELRRRATRSTPKYSNEKTASKQRYSFLTGIAFMKGRTAGLPRYKPC